VYEQDYVVRAFLLQIWLNFPAARPGMDGRRTCSCTLQQVVLHIGVYEGTQSVVLPRLSEVVQHNLFVRTPRAARRNRSTERNPRAHLLTQRRWGNRWESGPSRSSAPFFGPLLRCARITVTNTTNTISTECSHYFHRRHRRCCCCCYYCSCSLHHHHTRQTSTASLAHFQQQATPLAAV
jgi:hypothetical protein